MDLTVKGKQLDVGDALRTHAREALTAITEKYFNGAIDATVSFAKDAHRYRSNISVHVSRAIQMEAQAEADSPYAAFDMAADRLAKRLRRYKRRLTDHHKNVPEAEAITAAAYVLEAEPEEVGEDHVEPDQPVVVAEMTMDIADLTVSQAVMRLDLGDVPALMFRNRAHGRLNMVYRRKDGNIGWVDPQLTTDAG